MTESVNIFISMSFDDATTILNQYQSKDETNETLFEFAQQVLDEGEEDLQFEILVTRRMAEWANSMILDQKDESGIMEHIKLSYAEKTGIRFARY